MLTSYLKIIARNLFKYKISSLINILGLALGFSCSIIIFLYVENELSFDRFHHEPENVYRIVKDFVNDDGSAIPDATTPPALATALRQNLPEVAHVTRLCPYWGRANLVQYKDKRFYESDLLRVDSSFFDVFDFQFLSGTKENAFHGIHSVLLTESIARKYFEDENPVGKLIRININNGTDYIVTGVIKDIPKNSHFTFDMVIPFESRRNPDTDWNWYIFYTYARLKEGTDPALFESKVQGLFKKYQPASTNRYYIQPLTDIHLKSKLKWELSANGDLSTVRILAAIALFVIAIASINYINLVTAQSAKRAREVGVRKINGAFKSALVTQFLLESVLMALTSLIASLIIVNLLLPYSGRIFGYDLSVLIVQSQSLWLVLPASALLIGLLAGLYPAFYLSSFVPLKVLKGNFINSQGGVYLRQGLVTFQFVISSVLIIGSFLVTQQLDFMQKKKLGFDQENVMLLPNVRGGNNPEGTVEEMKKIPGVAHIGRADGILGFQNATNGVSPKNSQNHIALNFFRIDYEFLPALQIELKDGRNFSDRFRSDSTAIILNEKAVEQLGLREPLLGQQLEWDDENRTTHEVTVVGIVKDFHFASFHETIKPFGFILEVNNGSTFFVKIQSVDMKQTVSEIEKIWTKHNPDKPFEYSFQDEKMARLQLAETNFQKLFSSFTFLAIVISCLGLFGLVSYLADSKTKEIGIRKILGSSVLGVVRLLCREFVLLIVLAFVIAAPLAYAVTNYWLNGFAYRITIQWQVFVLAGVATVVIAFATISYQAVKAALANPVESLRNE